MVVSNMSAQGEHIQIHLQAVLRGHTREVLEVCFSPDGTFLASADDETIRLWNLVSEIPFQIIEHGGLTDTSRIDISRDGRLLVAVMKGQAFVWTKEGGVASTISVEGQHLEEAVFSPDGQMLVGGSTSGEVHIWDVKTRRLLSTFQAAPHPRSRLSFKGFEGASEFAWSHDGSRLALVSQDEQAMVQVWDFKDAGTGASWIASVIEPRHVIWALAFSPDGRFLAASDCDRNIVWLFDAHSLKPAGALNTPRNDTPKSIAFSPDGRWLAVAGGIEGYVWIWDVARQQIAATLEAHTEGYAEGSELWTIGALDWSPDGHRLATTGTSLGTFFDLKRQRFLGPDDYTVKLWEIQVEEETATS